VRNLCTVEGKSDAKSISWRRRFAKKRRASELGEIGLSWHVVDSSCVLQYFLRRCLRASAFRF
jgi:hypothetical protein